MEEKADRRVRKTLKQLRLCLTELMQQKNIKEITVRELTELADINRGTFYLHYRDVFDMLEKLENEILEKFEAVINNHSLEEIMEQPRLIFTDLFEFVEDNADMCRVLLGDNGDQAFLEKLTSKIKTKAAYGWLNAYSGGDEEMFEYYCAYVFSGCIGVIRQWTSDGMKIPPQTMAANVAEMVMRGAKLSYKTR